MNSSNDTLRQRALAFLKETGIDQALAAVVAVGSLLLFAFIKIADEVVEGETRTFDEAILLALRTPGDNTQPIGPLWLHEMVRDDCSPGSHLSAACHQSRPGRFQHSRPHGPGA